MTDAEKVINHLNGAVTQITTSILEKLDSVQSRVTIMRENIQLKQKELHGNLTDLVTLIDKASTDADVCHSQLDEIHEKTKDLLNQGNGHDNEIFRENARDFDTQASVDRERA